MKFMFKAKLKKQEQVNLFTQLTVKRYVFKATPT